MDSVKTFGGLLPEKRIAIIANREIDVSRIPSRFTLEMMNATRGGVDYSVVVKIIADICSKNAPEITPDFLLDNLGIDEINELVEYMMEPVTQKAKAKMAEAAGADPKNS
ncbi:hypothetical protein Metho_1230 [Methanomethylovorans hollandica DSM 15978]|uniref:Uncharacterized protein n=1 Tax=Methanomethylovorans hollandica (strain DSM 15978 / NBRC 107637 / DMS1) TaxID=867904 RepID=L0KXP0_METHD|nr:hypothetical protein [Methanomethylovorans hollandica]AGB49460.1 hypothetical protein Metho_1230 [Methanomethylovorans hollandica DSM 15978]